MKKPRERTNQKENPGRRKQKPTAPAYRKSDRKPETEKQEGIRLNRYLASAGIASRREADELITAGLVSVNGQVVTELGIRVKHGDEVRYNGERIRSEKPVYILMNKPKDHITTLRDPHAQRTVMDLIGKACRERVYPVGRLDKNTTGVLLLTNDGDLAKRLTHPKYNKKKIYHVTLDKSVKATDLRQIQEGLVLDDGPVQVDEVSYTDANDKSKIGIEIHSGRNRIVRRIFEHLGYKVRKLDRVYFAGLTKKGLTRGKWRFLDDQEITMLKMGAFK